MTNRHQSSAREYLETCREAVKEARLSGIEKQICLSLSDLGYALFQLRRFEQGVKSFEEALNIANRLCDLDHQVKCLEIQTLAFQSIGRLPDAFQAAQKIQSLGKQLNDIEVICDALASQGQILLDSGDPMQALDKFMEALQIAHSMHDQQRLMKLFGAMGHFSIAIVAMNEAEGYFDKALLLAQELGDLQAEIGYMGNKGMLLFWQERYAQAETIFLRVLSYAESNMDKQTEIEALRYLSQIYSKLEDDQKVLEYGHRGLEYSRKINHRMAYKFFELVIQSYYRQGLIDEAQRLTMDAVELARKHTDKSEEVDFLLSLGESYLAIEKPDEALEIYQGALKGANHIGRQKDEAYLTGRIGLALAEMGRLDEAIRHHEQALELARQRNLKELEGQQLSMLAMAYVERNMVEQATVFCRAAIDAYSEAGLDLEVANANELLSQIGSQAPPLNEIM